MSEISGLDILRATRHQLNDSSKWTKNGQTFLITHGVMASCVGIALVDNTPKTYGIDAAVALHEAVDAFVSSVGIHEEYKGLSAIYLWNDDPATTYEDVVAGFDKAIAYMERQTA